MASRVRAHSIRFAALNPNRGAIVNPKQRESRVLHADQIRARALHDLTRAREALALIRDIAEAHPCADSLRSIARLARAALAGSAPPDPAVAHGEDHKGDAP